MSDISTEMEDALLTIMSLNTSEVDLLPFRQSFSHLLKNFVTKNTTLLVVSQTLRKVGNFEINFSLVSHRGFRVTWSRFHNSYQ